MHSPFTPKEELTQRYQNLQARMAAADMALVLLWQKADLFYFTGTVQGEILIVPVEGEPIYLARKSTARTRAESALEKILPYRTFKDLKEIFIAEGLALEGRWGLELDVLPVNHYLKLSEIFPRSIWTDASPLIRQVRAVKSPYELEIMQEAARIVDHIMVYAAQCLKEGMAEWEWAAAIKGEALRIGHQGITKMRRWNQEFFFGHVLSGDSTTVPAYIDSPTGGHGINPYVGSGAGWKKIGRHEPLSVDMVGAWGGYLVDQARMYSLGELSAEIKEAYQAVLQIEQAAAAMLKPGIRADAVYEAARKMAADMGYSEFFMNFGDNKVNFVGHGVGIELDEYPVIAPNFDMVLEAGMTIALEPKIVFPQKGMAGIEDTYVVTEEGGRQLNLTGKEIFTL